MKKVLIVDDEEDVLLLLKSFLHSKGYDVATTHNCEHGLEIFYDFKPDLVLLDVKVGNEDGQVMCKTIKNQAEAQHIPILLMSADDNNLAGYTAHGAAGIVHKPFSLPKLHTTLQKHLSAHSNIANDLQS